MFKVKLVTVIALCGLVISCSTTKKPTEDEQRKEKTAKINAQLGIAYLEQNNIQRSKQKLMLALDQAPNIPETWYSMAYFYEATGNKDEARQYYLKALAVAPNRGDAKNNYGTFLCRSGDYTGSIQQFLAAANDRTYLDPADAYENAGLCALKIPDNEKAAHYFQQALTEDPSRPLSLMRLAELDYKSGNYKNSERLLSKYLEISAPSEQSVRLGKLLVLKAHSGDPLKPAIEVAEKKELEPVAVKKIVTALHEPSNKVLKAKSSKKIASKNKVKVKTLHAKLGKVKSNKMVSMKHQSSKKKHKSSVVTAKKAPKKIKSTVV